MDFSREELEAEVWRLRSVEIDVENLQEENRNLRTLHSEQAGLTADLTEARSNMERRYEEERTRRQGAERDYDAAQKALGKAHAERDWALDKLQAYEDADYMYRNYDFKLADEMPEPPRKKGWRLTK